MLRDPVVLIDHGGDLKDLKKKEEKEGGGVVVYLDAIVDWQTGVREAWKFHFSKCRAEAATSPPPSPSSDSLQSLREVSIKTNFSNRSRSVSADSSAFETSSCDDGTVSSSPSLGLASSDSVSTFQVGSGKSLDDSSCEFESGAPQVEEMKSPHMHMHPCRSALNMCDLDNCPDAPFIPDPKQEYSLGLIDLAANHHHFLATSLSNLEPHLNMSNLSPADLSGSGRFLELAPEAPEILLQKHNGIIRCTPQSFNPLLELIIHLPRLFSSFPAREGAIKALREMLAKGINVRISFPPLELNAFSAHEELEWVRTHLGAAWLEKVVLADPHCSVNFDLRIDDECHDSSTAREKLPQKHILLETPYNQDISEQFQPTFHMQWSQWSEVLLPLLHKSLLLLRLSQNNVASLRAAPASDALVLSSGWVPEPLSQTTASLAQGLKHQVHLPGIRYAIPQGTASIQDEDSKWAAFAACFQEAAKDLAGIKKGHVCRLESHEPISESSGVSSSGLSDLDASGEESAKYPGDVEDCRPKTKGVREMCLKCSHGELCSGGMVLDECDIDREVAPNCIMKDLLSMKVRGAPEEHKLRAAQGPVNCLGYASSQDVPLFANPNPYHKSGKPSTPKEKKDKKKDISDSELE